MTELGVLGGQGGQNLSCREESCTKGVADVQESQLASRQSARLWAVPTAFSASFHGWKILSQLQFPRSELGSGLLPSHL